VGEQARQPAKGRPGFAARAGGVRCPHGPMSLIFFSAAALAFSALSISVLIWAIFTAAALAWASFCFSSSTAANFSFWILSNSARARAIFAVAAFATVAALPASARATARAAALAGVIPLTAGGFGATLTGAGVLTTFATGAFVTGVFTNLAGAFLATALLATAFW